MFGGPSEGCLPSRSQGDSRHAEFKARPKWGKGENMDNSHVDLILRRLAALDAQHDRQTDKLTELRSQVASLAALLERIDERLERIERRPDPMKSPRSEIQDIRACPVTR